MNERIRQLALQAGHPGFPRGEIELQKFAESIVRKCAELANEGTSFPYDSYSDKIKHYFGVEL